MASNDNTGPTPAYVSFPSFLTFLEFLKGMSAIPSEFDRSLWEGKFSGSTGKQLVGAFHFLGLLDKDRPTEKLERLLQADQETRPEVLKDIFRASYGEELVDGIASMTPRMMDDRIEGLGTTDSTKRKAISFFTNGAKYLDLDMPATIRKRARMRRSASKPSPATPRKSDAPPVEPKTVSTEQRTDTQAAVELQLDLHPTLMEMLKDLPNRMASWSDQKQQDEWLGFFGTALKYYHPVGKGNGSVNNTDST